MHLGAASGSVFWREGTGWARGPKAYQTQPNHECQKISLGVSPWGINFTDERETTQTTG